MTDFRSTWHWREYAIEAWALAMFMVSAAVWTMILEHPASPLRQAIADGTVRRVLMGAAMGTTAIALIYSPLGERSGAHMNPATTLAFARLKKIAPHDALAYCAAQFLGGFAGLAIVDLLLPGGLGHPAVNYLATVPGAAGIAAAFVAEVLMSFTLMLTVLVISSGPHARYTGLCAGALVAAFIALEAPLSGMSLNPARSVASALVGAAPESLWIYVTAPFIGMAAAGEVFVRRRGLHAVVCAKLHHAGCAACVFGCRTTPTSSVHA